VCSLLPQRGLSNQSTVSCRRTFSLSSLQWRRAQAPSPRARSALTFQRLKIMTLGCFAGGARLDRRFLPALRGRPSRTSARLFFLWNATGSSFCSRERAPETVCSPSSSSNLCPPFWHHVLKDVMKMPIWVLGIFLVTDPFFYSGGKNFRFFLLF